MKILFLSHTFIGGNYFVGSHSLHNEALLSGHHSLHVSTPISFFHILKFLLKIDNKTDLIRRVHKSKEGIINNSYIPRVLLPIQLKYSKYFLGKKLRNVLNSSYDKIFLDQIAFLNIFPSINTKNLTIRITDKLSNKEIKIIKRTLSPSAKIIVTNSSISNDLLPYFSNIKVIPNPIISDFPDALPTTDSLRSGGVYVGALGERIDWEYVKNLAKEPEFEMIHLFGSGLIPLDLPENIVYLGIIDHADVLGVLAQYKFGLFPYSPSRENECRSPIKTMDYLTSGLIIIRPQAIAGYSMFNGLATHDPLHKELNYKYETTDKKHLEGVTWRSVWKELSVD
jgi:hypothetical protein